jgi:hypothetical protein
MLRPWAAALAVVLFFTLTATPHVWQLLFHPGIVNGHETTQKTLWRLEQFHIALRDGHIPPRWAPDLDGGYGLPFFNYYQPLFFYLAELAYLCGCTFLGAIRLVTALLVPLSGIAAYLWARHHWGRGGALLSGVLLQYAPYHLADLYVRGAFSELTVFPLLPLALWAVERVLRRGGLRAMAGAAAIITLLCLGHNAITLFAVPLLVLLALLGPAPTFRRRIQSLGAIALGLGGAASFLLPALLERNLVHIERLITAYFRASAHLVYPVQLFSRLWASGPSNAGPDDRFPFGLGIPHLLALAAALMLLLFRVRRLSPGQRRVTQFTTGGLALLTFLITTPSAPLWERLPLIRYAQFPWRLLAMHNVLLAFLGGAAVWALAQWTAPLPAAGLRGALSRHEGLLLGAAASAAVIAAYAAGGYLRGFNFVELPDTRTTHRGEVVVGFVTTTAENEYQPRTARARPAAPAMKKYEVRLGELQVLEWSETTARYSARLRAETPAILRINTYRFPGWTARLDGEPIPLRPYTGPEALIELRIPPGEHRLEVRLESTPLQRASNVISVVSLAAMLLLALPRGGRRRP